MTPRRLDLTQPLPEQERRRLQERLLAGSSEVAGCRVWHGSVKNQYGHAQISVHDRPEYVHRVAYAVFIGPIPDGLNVCHSCDNPPCILPAHLFLGTDADNARDMWAKGRGVDPPRISGTAHHMVRLTDAQVEEIRRRWAAGGIQQRDLARQYGCSQSTIWRLVHRVTRHPASGEHR